MLELESLDSLRIAPTSPASRKQKFDRAQEWAHRRYDKAFERLANE
jgi:hypothetical protein